MRFLEKLVVTLLSLLCHHPYHLKSSDPFSSESGASSSSSDHESPPPWSARVVNTKFGAVKGLLFTVKGYEGVEVFYGLPYASAPVGSLRLMPPVSGSPWSGTKANLAAAPVCPQVLPQIDNETEALRTMPKGRLAQLKRLLPLLKNQSEDCLYLNLYVPLTVANGKAGGPLSVLVFVQGEDNGWGAGHPYDPSLLASQGNVIVVTMAFRVGILGFLNANSDGYFKSPANFALLDIIAALHWTQENIGSFGGDRTNVTLMGHGKGAIYVNFLMISTTVPTGLLFHRVILMSGSAVSPLASGLSHGKELAKRFAAEVKCPVEPPSSTLHCLRQVPLQYFLDSELWTIFGPSEDGVIIEDGIRENVLRDRISHYPLLFGVTKAELLPSLSEHDAAYGLEIEKRRDVLRSFVEKYYSIHRNEILAAAIHEYTDWERPIQHPISVRDETLDALSDALIVAPLVKVGDLHSQSNSKSYFYVFEYQSKISDYQQRLGCSHGEELNYIFGVPLYYSGDSMSDEKLPRLGYFSGNFSRNEVTLSQTVMGYWANFIRTGNPSEEKDGDSSRGSNEKTSKSRIVDWPPYDPLYKKYLTIDTKPRVRTHYRAHKLSFWLHLVPDLQRNGYGAPNGHNAVNPFPLPPPSSSGSKGGPSLSHPSSGLVILPPEDTSANSSTPSPPTIQLVGPGPPVWDHSLNQPHGNFYPDAGVRGGGNNGEVDGLQMYSTALSVTIAIGSTLIILNILIFFAFYYQRDKRRVEEAEEMEQQQYHDQRHHHQQQPSSPRHQGYPGYQGHATTQHGGITYTRADVIPSNACPGRRKENGQIGGAIIPFDANSSDTGYGSGGGGPRQQYPSHYPSLKRGQKNAATQQSNCQYEMPMPDAVLAATAATEGLSVTFADSPDCSLKSGCSGSGMRSCLTMMDQVKVNSESCGGYESGSRTVPRPPKRTTPTVKFGPETNLESSPGTGNGGGGGTTPLLGFSSGSQTLKPSLKKPSLNYSCNSDELRV